MILFIFLEDNQKMASKTLSNLLIFKPMLLDPKYCCFPEDIVIKINNIICDEYIKQIYVALEHNFIKNSIGIFLNDKTLSKFLYYSIADKRFPIFRTRLELFNAGRHMTRL